MKLGSAVESLLAITDDRDRGIITGIGDIDKDQRATVVLVDIEGLSYDEVSHATGANVGTVKSRLSRARATLRDFLVQQAELVPAHYRLQSES